MSKKPILDPCPFCGTSLKEVGFAKHLDKENKLFVHPAVPRCPMSESYVDLDECDWNKLLTRWIKCSDRLPDNIGEYTCYAINHFCMGDGWSIRTLRFDGRRWRNPSFHSDDGLEVSHWMRLDRPND